MNAELSAHAQEELELRNISVQLVQRVLDHPDQIVEVNELKVYHRTYALTEIERCEASR